MKGQVLRSPTRYLETTLNMKLILALNENLSLTRDCLYLEKLITEFPTLPQNQVVDKNHRTSPIVPLTNFLVFRIMQVTNTIKAGLGPRRSLRAPTDQDPRFFFNFYVS